MTINIDFDVADLLVIAMGQLFDPKKGLVKKAMAFLRRIFGQTTVSKPTRVYTGTKSLEVKGESNYQSELAAIAGPRTKGGHDDPVLVVLVREPTNEYDANAIAVYANRKDWSAKPMKVGYIAKETAVKLAPAIDHKNQHGEVVGLSGSIIGGWDRGGGDVGHYGVWLKYDPDDFTR